MAGFNEAILMGNLARDPDIRYTQSGIPVANMTLAVNRPPKKANRNQLATFFLSLHGINGLKYAKNTCARVPKS